MLTTIQVQLWLMTQLRLMVEVFWPEGRWDQALDVEEREVGEGCAKLLLDKDQKALKVS